MVSNKIYFYYCLLFSVARGAKTIKLKPYQKDAVKRIRKSHQLILADEMGLGKTATILSGIKKSISKGKRFLVVCPASLKLNWCKEINMWLNIDVKPDVFHTGIITVTNYERLSHCVKWAQRYSYHGVIFDEAHYLKTSSSQRHFFAKECSKFMRKIFLLTGTPMVSGPCDIAPLLDIMNLLPVFGGYESFYKRYCDPVWNGYGWDYTGASNQKELRGKLHNYMIRRTKGNCGIVLPQNNIIDIPIMSIEQPYASTFKVMEEQQKAVNNKKLPLAVEFINNLLSNGKRPVVFLHHRDLLSKLRTIYPDSVSIVGGQSMEERQDCVNEFQEGKHEIIFCSLQASATGVTLTSSDTVVFLEYLWSPSISKQAQDRVHRITQNKEVNVYNLYAMGSIEMQKNIRSFVKQLDMGGIL